MIRQQGKLAGYGYGHSNLARQQTHGFARKGNDRSASVE
jgi:hypothetical protein